MSIKEDFWNNMDDCVSVILNAFSEINSRNGIFITDMKTDITWWSEQMVKYLGFSDSYIHNTRRFFENHIHPEDMEIVKAGFEKRLQGIDCDKEFEYRIQGTDGQYNLFTVTTKLIYNSQGKAQYFIGSLINQGISVKIDAVTMLHNRTEFTRHMEWISQQGRTVALLKIGIDSFSHINVMYGTAYADSVLREVAQNLKSIVKNFGQVYRSSGAKFVFVFEDMQREKLIRMTEQIQEHLAREISIEGKRVPLKLSAGALLLENFSGDVDSAKRKLTYAFNHSKRKHHGNLVIFNDEVSNGENGNLDLIKIIHQSVLDGCEGFYLCYQPIVEARTGQLIGMEALVRWEKEPYGKVPPGMFIEWLEEDPCMYELGNWIVRRAITDAKKIAEKIPNFFVNINISATQIERRDFKDTVVDILQELSYPGNRLCLELTERCREMDMEYLKAQIDFFKTHGIKIAVDDFGTGSASLGMVSKLAVDELKIDMSFVRNIQERPVNQAIVKSIINMANESNLTTCIEGVENGSLMEYLQDYNATWHQGYFYSKPLPIHEFIQIIENMK